jgi:hypothetical protein
MAGASIHQNLFPDGCEFRLISNEPRDTLGNSWFRLVEFEHRRTGEDPDNPAHYTGTVCSSATAWRESRLIAPQRSTGIFRDPSWYQLDDPAKPVGCEVPTWPRGEYTVAALFGHEGEAVRAAFAANTRATGDRLSKLLEG